MNTSEAAKLLTVAAGFDRRQVTDVTATAWAAALKGHTYSECERAIIAHHRDPATRTTYLTVGHVLDRVEAGDRTSAADVETDVRAAKARGIIVQDWPRREPLTPEAAYKLRAARERDRQEAIRHTSDAISPS
ncbi:hypothetical protein AB0230_06965 [Microbacterium sp. NPDC089190]|uniref:hypothetical protein n=1 Tax=Microbacterium sp. NPDC089190 TaxID=3155063 RepID=UPI00344E90AE